MLTDIKGKNVLFITTKNLDYIRNKQEIDILKKESKSCTVIGSNNKYYFIRLLIVYFSLFKISAAKFDTVFIGFAPQLVLPLFKHKFRHLRIVIDFFISLFDTLCEDRRLFSSRGLCGSFLHYLDQITLHQADWVICDTVSHGEYFTGEFGISPAQLYTLYLQADTAIYHPRPAKKPGQLKDQYVVLYFGSILPLQGIDTVLKAITLLKNEQNIFFYIIGPVRRKDRIALCPDGVNAGFINWLPQEDLADYISQADLCLAGHFNNHIAKAKRTIPGKAYIYQAMGKPMVLGDNPANHELFKPDHHHIFVEMGNPRALADTILSLSAGKDRNASYYL